ncbi:MAG TPA: tetratricopeptide repeat protein [Phycisphaerales bacterium]|nr:tetratricopeptide repeat protein [Phycisphaerales bacterium]
MKPLHSILFFFAVLLALVLLYAPSVHGTPLMDDDILIFQNHNLTRDSFSHAPGLKNTWTSLSANQDFYPLTLTSWWLQYQLFHDNYFPYHFINLLLHALNATLLLLILNRLLLPLFVSLFSALLFALHPINVQSVAWMAEHKNTLSALFYFLTILAYLRAIIPPSSSLRSNDVRASQAHSKTRGGLNFYVLALILFILAMLSKPLTMTLAACLPLLSLIRNRRLTLRDLLLCLPFLALTLPMIYATVRVQTLHLGVTGPAFHLSILQRILLAPNVIAHYLSKLAFPYPLTFAYEKWPLNPDDILLWIAPLALLLLFTALIIFRRNPIARAILIAFLWFILALSPALGFRPIFWHLYYYVADHIAYLPAIPMFVLFAAGIHKFTLVLKPDDRTIRFSPFALLIPFAALTYIHARAFAGPVAVWQQAMNASPKSPLPYMNLGVAIASDPIQPDFKLARQLLEQSIQCDPTYADAHLNLGRLLLLHFNDLDGARAQFRAAIDNAPAKSQRTYSDSLVNLAFLLDKAGETQQAISAINTAIQFAPGNVDAWYNLGTFNLHANDLNAALSAFNQALVLDPVHASAHANLGVTLQKLNRPDDARLEFLRAIQSDTKPDGAHGPIADFAQKAMNALPPATKPN